MCSNLPRVSHSHDRHAVLPLVPPQIDDIRTLTNLRPHIPKLMTPQWRLLSSIPIPITTPPRRLLITALQLIKREPFVMAQRIRHAGREKASVVDGRAVVDNLQQRVVRVGGGVEGDVDQREEAICAG